MKTLELNNLPTPVLLVWDIGRLVVDGNGQYCPNCYTDRLFDSNNLCVTCGGDPHSEDFFAEGFEDEGFAYQQTKLYDLIGELSELTEEQAKGLVKDIYVPTLGVCYIDYLTKKQENKQVVFGSACESFYSALGEHFATPPANTLIFKRS